MEFIHKENNILITGVAGFIGAALAYRLVKEGISIVGIDNLNNYYDTDLKRSRLKRIQNIDTRKLFKFIETDIENKNLIIEIFEKFRPKIVINLAAQAGVRYSIIDPYAYINTNLLGFSNILEACRNFDIRNLIYASSSSVYGGNKKLPYREDSDTDKPISLYAATKKSNELLAYSYSHLYGIPSIGLRFFTVYGPWGRPDMAPMIFANSLKENMKIKIFNNGDMLRDFTYIEDVVDAVIGCCNIPIKNYADNVNSKKNPHMIFNVGNSNPIKLLDFIKILEKKFNLKANKEFLPIQPGDVKETFADISMLKKYTGFKPKTNISKGLDEFSKWYMHYYGI